MSHDPLSPPAVLSVLQDLIRIPSVNPTLAPAEGQGEGRIAEFAARWLNDHGVEAWTEEAAPGRPNVVGRVRKGDGPTLVLCAHLDTVATDGMTIDPFEPTLRDGRVYGRGSYDMKSGVVACMSAAAELARGSFDGCVMLALVADEEYASVGAQHFVEHHPADACILTEPSEGRLMLAHKGFVWAAFHTEGTAAHGSRWELGESAIGKAARIVIALEAFDRDVLRKRDHPLVGPASMHCALVEGGSGISTYAPHCTIKVERRTIPGETGEEAMNELRRTIAEVEPDARSEMLLAREPMTTSRDAPIAVAVRDAATQVTGEIPREDGVAYWMDAALFDAAGIPTVDFGPAGAGAHAAVEWTDLESVVTCARVLTEAARRFVR